MRRLLVLLIAVVAALATMAMAPAAFAGGPVVLMGIDAENGGPNGHGPPATYTNLVNNVDAQSVKPGGVETVIVGCKAGTNTGTFWTTVRPVHRCVVGGAAITAETFVTAKLVIVVSDQINTPSGGLTCQDEDQALDDVGTQTELAAHVNAGGGLIGMSSDCPRPFQYIAGVANIGVQFPPQYDNIDPTTEGLALGVNNSLDVCCWHDVFTNFPSFLKVLAFRAGTQQAAAIGGAEVVVPPPVREPTRIEVTPRDAQNLVDTDHTFHAIVYDQFDQPMEDVEVGMQVDGASGHIAVLRTTDQNGVATLTYHGPALPGSDTNTVCIERDASEPGCQPEDLPLDTTTKTWFIPASSPNCAVDLNKETGGGQIIARNGDKFSFGGNAKVGPQGDTTGEQEARDHGPIEPFHFHGKVIAVVCVAGNEALGQPGRATIFAFGEFDNSLTGMARIDVEDFGEPGSLATDTYRYRKQNYDTEVQPLKSGNIQIHQSS